MSDDDLIRRGDALNALGWGDIYGRNAQDAIAALPAVTQPAPDACTFPGCRCHYEAGNPRCEPAPDADNVLEQAIGVYDEMLIIGWDKDGQFDARATLGLKYGGDCLWLVETFKFKLLKGDFHAEEAP